MNETLNNIKNRRSIRSFKSEQINDSELQMILDAAVEAPSAMNQQKWHFTVIQNKNLLEWMVKTIKEKIVNSDSEFLRKRAADKEFNPFYKAPTLIIISGEEKNKWTHLDCGLAVQNIVLAAQSLNIGSCILGATRFLFESNKTAEYKKELGIPEGYSHICSISLGYLAGDAPSPTPRNKDVVNYIK